MPSPLRIRSRRRAPKDDPTEVEPDEGASAPTQAPGAAPAEPPPYVESTAVDLPTVPPQAIPPASHAEPPEAPGAQIPGDATLPGNPASPGGAAFSGGTAELDADAFSGGTADSGDVHHPLTEDALPPGDPEFSVEAAPVEVPGRDGRRGRHKASRRQTKESRRERKARAKRGLVAAPPPPSPQTEKSSRMRNAKAARARRRVARRPAVIAAIVVIAILSATVTVTGLVVAAEMGPASYTLAYPLQIYPVAQTTQGQCLPGTQGVSGPGPFCYEVTEGLAIHRVNTIKTQHDKSFGYSVFVRLDSGDKKAFARLTKATLHGNLVFVVNNRLVTVSKVDTPIVGGQILIAGLNGRGDADRVVRNLRGKP